MIANSARLRLLCLGPQNIWPPVDGGKEGIHGALGGLAKRCDVTYAFPSPSGETVRQADVQPGVHPIAVPWLPRDSAALIVSSTLRGQPYKFEKYSSADAVSTFARAVPRQAYDAIFCFHAHTARLGEGLRNTLGLNVPVLLREHNIEYELVASYRRSLSPWLRAAAWPFELLTRRAEQRSWARADAVAFLSDRDLATARATGAKGRLLLAREGIPLPPRRPAVHPGANAPLLLLLNPKAGQSVLNLREFLHRCWSTVATDPRMCTTALQVTGVTTERLAELVGMDITRLKSLRVQGLGFLPSLEEVLASSLGLISPTYVGGGIRKKILEAMAHQLPVVATRLDIETCSYFESGRNILELAEQPDSLAEQVAVLRDDPKAWLRLASQARDTVEVNASWDLFATSVIDEIRFLKRCLDSGANTKVRR